MNKHPEINDRVAAVLDSRLQLLRIQGTRVILTIKERLPTPERGKLLLDTEKYLRREISPDLEVLLEPKGDLSKLRERLRGISLDGSRESVFTLRYQRDEILEDGSDDEKEPD